MFDDMYMEDPDGFQSHHGYPDDDPFSTPEDAAADVLDGPWEGGGVPPEPAGDSGTGPSSSAPVVVASAPVAGGGGLAGLDLKALAIPAGVGLAAYWFAPARSRLMWGLAAAAGTFLAQRFLPR